MANLFIKGIEVPEKSYLDNNFFTQSYINTNYYTNSYINNTFLTKTDANSNFLNKTKGHIHHYWFLEKKKTVQAYCPEDQILLLYLEFHQMFEDLVF